MSAKENKLLVAAIDFGTTHSGYAFVNKHEDISKITANSVWAGGNLMSMKCPTCVLFDENKKFHSFGYEAEDTYSDLANDDEHKTWYFFRHFKMSLHKNEIKSDYEIPDDKGLVMPAKTVFGSAIKYLKTHLLETLKYRKTGVAEKDIYWVLTVPAIWSDEAKQFMREAAVSEAEINGGSLTIALEPEAASLYCQLLPSNTLAGSGRLTANKYMVLDLGGATANINVHEKQADGSLREVHEPTRGPWGGTKVNEVFHQMLIKIIGAITFKSFCDNHKADHMDLLREIEAKKRTITPASVSKITVKTPVSLSDEYKKVSGETIAEAIKGTSLSGKMSWVADKFRIDAGVFKGLFQECINGVKQCVKELLQKPQVKDVDTLLMVGGFSESPMMQAAIKEAFPNANIIIPADAGLVVLKGAVVFGTEIWKSR